MPKIVLTVSNNGNGTLTIRRFRLVNTGGPVKGSHPPVRWEELTEPLKVCKSFSTACHHANRAEKANPDGVYFARRIDVRPEAKVTWRTVRDVLGLSWNAPKYATQDKLLEEID
jgi:hypothetical protein